MKCTYVLIIIGGVMYQTVAYFTSPSNLQWVSQVGKPASNRQSNCPDKCRCGVPNTISRIIGGVPAKITEFPWMAYVQTIEDNGTDIIPSACGGALINDRYVLTAAHCIKGLSENGTAIMGISDFNNPDNMIWKDASEYIVHSGYNNKTTKNDIALIKLADPVDFSEDIGTEDYIVPVCLPEAGPTFLDETVTVAGWGSTTGNGTGSDQLYKVDIPIVRDIECLRRYGLNFNPSTMLCAGTPDGSKGTCRGDSGGSIYHQKADGALETVGVVSYGKKFCETYSSYTRVNKYLDWITQNTADACTCK